MPDERDLQEEQEFLDKAYEGLEAMRAEATRMLESVLDVGRGGTFQSRTERDIVVRTSMARLAQLDIGDQALCFGRIDRAPEPGASPGESFHIGRLAVSAPDHEPLVVDWRAPVAEPFYRATGLDPQGLSRRRHLAVSGRMVSGVEDEYFGAAPDGTASAPAGVLDPAQLGGPGALLAALGQARTGHMGDIVATIQREQDEIIRSPLPGVLMVQGGPGTGKTAVALHRAAYLLYTHRFPLERQGVLVVGPNPLFLRYIERVLPSLGETGVVLSTVAGLVPEIRVRGTDEPWIARLKGEPKMATVIARAVRTRQRPLREDVEVPFGATTLRLAAADTEQIVATARRRPGPHNARRRYVEQQVLDRLTTQYDRARRRTLGDQASPPVHQDAGNELDLAEIARQLRRVPAVATALDRMWPRLLPHELVHDLFGAKPLLAAAGRGVLGDTELGALFRSRSTSLDEVRWTVADAALVDEARALLGPRRPRARRRPEQGERADQVKEIGFWPPGLGTAPVVASNGARDDEEIRSFGHIVVDEAQDLSPMQLRMLARRSISGSMTVVGDVAQATGPWAPSDWHDVAAHLTPARPPRIVELTVGYRTPAEVMELAAGVLRVAAPTLTPPTPVRRSGQIPTVTHVPRADLGAAVARIAAHEMAAVGAGRTAVLVPSGNADDVVAALEAAGLAPVDPRQPGGPGLAAPLVVLPAGESHGLEFDAVVVVEPALIAAGSEHGTRRGRGDVAHGAPAGDEPRVPSTTTHGLRALYVALTRPTQRLAVVHSLGLPEGLERG